MMYVFAVCTFFTGYEFRWFTTRILYYWTLIKHFLKNVHMWKGPNIRVSRRPYIYDLLLYIFSRSLTLNVISTMKNQASIFRSPESKVAVSVCNQDLFDNCVIAYLILKKSGRVKFTRWNWQSVQNQVTRLSLITFHG